MVWRILLAALATVMAASPGWAKCTYTGLKPLEPIVGGPVTDPGTTPPPAPQPPATPQAPATPSDKPADTATPTTPAPVQPGPGFAYHPPGDLVAQDADRARKGDRFVYLEDIVYPIKLGPGLHAHMNSQIWGRGGGGWGKTKGPGGTECDPLNYDPMLQRDNYCEVRDNDSTHKMPLCPKGYGHQGQDIRPPACPGSKWQAVAVVDGIIQTVTGFSYLTLKGKDGTVYAYLHMAPGSVKVKAGDKVKQGDVLGNVSNVMDYDAGGTTYHLHFQVKQQLKVGSKVLTTYVPVYSSLIAAYRKAKGLDPGIDKNGNLIVDPALEIGAAPKPVETKPEPQPEPKPEPTTAEPPKPAEPPAKADDIPPVPAPQPQPTPAKEVPPQPAPAPAKSDQQAPSAPAPTPEPASEPTPPAPPPAPAEDKTGQTEPPPAPAPAPQPEPTKPVEPSAPPTPPAPPAPEQKPDSPQPSSEPAPTKPVEPPAPAPEPAPAKPSEPPSGEYPVPPAPAESPTKPPEPPGPSPAPSPAQPGEAKPAPTTWWGTVKNKVGGWWSYWWEKK